MGTLWYICGYIIGFSAGRRWGKKDKLKGERKR